MNREIKFRVFNNGKMRIWEDLQIIEIHPEFSWFIEDKNWKIMQFTGLKDKNGKEIYEGDVITLPADGKSPHINFQVVWNTSVVGFKERSIEEEPYQSDIDPYKVIIGNIYENPELLNVVKS